MDIILTPQQIKTFQKTIYDHYHTHGRTFAWRITEPCNTISPYHIFVSEVMLQQTQTSRVAKLYPHFIQRFPDFRTLANAALHDVLHAWQGLGYNRRARFLHQSATTVHTQYNDIVPRDVITLQTLPGIGQATAASIAAFAYDEATVFVETNIRTVLIHTFLPDQEHISDKTLLSLVEQTLDRSAPRAWYYALTDYGVMLKSKGINPIHKSKAYNPQSKFEGSDRQIRGAIIKALLTRPYTLQALCHALRTEQERTNNILQKLLSEHMVVKQGTIYTLPK